MLGKENNLKFQEEKKKVVTVFIRLCHEPGEFVITAQLYAST